MIFDVLTEPWMGVVDKETGEVLKVGLRNYIVNACLCISVKKMTGNLWRLKCIYGTNQMMLPKSISIAIAGISFRTL